MSEKILSTRPPNSGEKDLRAKFAESIAGQSEQMDKLAQQLITLELAVPGLYAVVLKLTQGDDATLALDYRLYLTFLCWSTSLLLTLISLIPRRWKVDPTILKTDTKQGRNSSDSLGLEEFFYRSARYKRRLLIPATVIFWLGIMGAVWALV